MTNSTYDQAATELLKRRIAGTKAPTLSEDIRPKNLEDVLQIHESMIKLHSDTVGGWKCLLPPSDEKIVVAPIFSKTVQRGDNCELFKDLDVARIEPEICFVLSKDLTANPDGYTEEQINNAIGSCHMALELVQSRYAKDSGFEFFDSLADCLINQGLFIGPEIDREKAFSAEKINIGITHDEQKQTFEGKHPNSLPQKPLYWLIDFMTRRGTTFKAGEAIITGSYCGVVEAEFEKLTTISYEGIGDYQVTLNEK